MSVARIDVTWIPSEPGTYSINHYDIRLKTVDGALIETITTPDLQTVFLHGWASASEYFRVGVQTIDEQGNKSARVWSDYFTLVEPSAPIPDEPPTDPGKPFVVVTENTDTKPPVDRTAHPELLPAASGQRPQSQPNISAGQTYQDPTTDVTVLRLTDGNTPFSGNGRGVPDYSDGGPYISQPWTQGGETYYTVYVMVDKSPSTHYFVDVRLSDMTSHDWRQLSTMSNRDLQWCWSLDPTTPRVGYGLHMPEQGTIRKFDTDAMVEITGGGFPKSISESRLSWLQNSINDEWFVLSDDGTVYAYNPNTGVTYTWNVSGLDEPHIDRAGDYVYVIADDACGPISGMNMTQIYSLETGQRVQISPNIQIDGWFSACKDKIPNTHVAGILGYMVSVNPHTSLGSDARHEYRYDPYADKLTTNHDEDDYFNSSGHRAGQWVFGNNPGSSQWYLISNWSGSGAFREAVGFMTADLSDQPRLLAHHYVDDISGDYYNQPHATMSPDGKLVMWGSDMGGSGRTDAFVAVVP